MKNSKKVITLSAVLLLLVIATILIKRNNNQINANENNITSIEESEPFISIENSENTEIEDVADSQAKFKYYYVKT